MQMQMPTEWTGDLTAVPVGYILGFGTASSYQRVADEAARAAGCVAAFVCRIEDGVLVVIAQGGDSSRIDAVPRLAPRPLRHQSGDAVVQTISPIDDAALADNLHFSGLAATTLKFAAVTGIVCDGGGLLIVAHNEPRPLLNAAQTYVLRAHAAHLATLFEVARLRVIVDGADCADQRERVERLRLLESVAVHARDSIVITEAEPVNLPGPRILYCNAAFTRATGYEPDEVIGRTPRLLQGEKTDPTSRARLRQALEAWEPIEIEMINYRKDGTEFWVELSIVPIADERGWFTHWVSVQRDITDRKDAEQLALRIRLAESENEALACEIQERKRVEAELLYTAFHDNLTRLRNRAFFMERLAAALDRWRESEHGTCSVLFLDLDQFKVVNDSLGHIAGDALLQEIAHRLKGCIRPQDTLARIGGDEFAVLIEDADDLAMPVSVAERIIGALRPPVQLGRQSVFPSCSIGIVEAADRAAVPEDLIRDADIAMYEAKRAGYGDYAIFNASMHDNAIALLALQTDLRHALDRGEFRLVYQPIVNPTTKTVVSFEALLRWEHPERGTVSPTDFVPVAEQIGLIRQIDRWVMREACQQLKLWQVKFAQPDLRMSVNTSAAEFVDPDFLGDLDLTLKEFDIHPTCLELEITEGIFLNPSPYIAETITRVRELGVRIALDDFGTGYSSLSYINRYPIDTIKIDKSFIDGLCEDSRTAAIVELIIKLGATLQVGVIAEGVETVDQVTALAMIGCDAVQGYYFAKPLPQEKAEAILTEALNLSCH
ncbi:hypothetical protein HMP09_2725 [Sphingomonas sp. HMP9]|uniref:putative bifunctional diguanylate cyclase/phosphodiesterase n=1 Tax=Sphingomonas sp. HMP9 TaxID=1517554 RepID=UPI0015974F0A|nr:EAL domain-containing protein [Sphingomonas sp. HMP9]BCA63491.1 hypothetical protein HMP09_2725 [Sphingomonas sp. HMP9]